jgi:acetyltransferase
LTEADSTRICTKDGDQLQVRPLRTDDGPLLVDLFEHLGADSRYLRFNVALTNLDPALVHVEAERMASVSQTEGRAWLVIKPPEATVVAGARYLFTGPGTAEASVAVRDDWQRRGVGTELLAFLVDQARADGVATLTATVQLGNVGIWRLLRASKLPYERALDGPTASVQVDITEN